MHTTNDTLHRSVLVVDDDPGVLESLTDALHALGARVTAAADHHEAQQHLRSSQFHLVVTDLRLDRGEEGLAVARYAKHRHPATKVVLISGLDLEDLSSDADRAGVDEMIPKPVPIAALDRILHDLGVREPQRQSRDSNGTTRLDDEEGQTLLQSHLAGSPDALPRIIDAYTPMIYSVFLRWFRLGQDDADDLYQEVLLQLVVKASSIRNVRMWLLGTAINQAKKRIRRLIRERKLTERYIEELELAAPEDREDVRELIGRGLALLKPADRLLLSLIYIQGLSYQEVASVLERPIGSIGPLRGRALKRLTAAVAQLEESPSQEVQASAA